MIKENHVLANGIRENSETNGILLGGGCPWRQQYQINDSQNSDIFEWSNVGNLPNPIAYFGAIVTKNRVYLLGGRDEYNVLNTVYTAAINSDGTLDKWITSDPLPEPLFQSQALVIKNRVYLLGGCGKYCFTNVVYTAPINDDGTLGKWIISDPLPLKTVEDQVIVTKNYVYILGGYTDDRAVTDIYRAPINRDGTFGVWEKIGNLPIDLSFSRAIFTKNRIYLLGGYSRYGVMDTVYTALINSDGILGEWTNSYSLPDTLFRSRSIVTTNRVYLLGGDSGYEILDTIYTASINNDGTLGEWTKNIPLPYPLSNFQAIVTKNHIYILGGLKVTTKNHNYLLDDIRMADKEEISSNVIRATFSGGLNDYSQYYNNSM